MADQEQLHPQKGLVLAALDGSNPLGFLTALGALRGITAASPGEDVRMSWVALDAWRPALQIEGIAPTEGDVLERLSFFMAERAGHAALSIGNNLNIKGSEFRRHSLRFASCASFSPSQRDAADFLASFGCDGIVDARSGTILDTAFRTMSGAGHQHFLKTMRDLSEGTDMEQVGKSLFRTWSRSDAKNSLRWDPSDDRRYALRWKNPSKDGTNTEWGANRLAFEALSLFPTMPGDAGINTTGFSGRGARSTRWTWPIWNCATNLDTVRSLLALRQLQDTPPDHEYLAAMGIVEVFQSYRITNGKYRNFTQAMSI